MTVAGNGSGQVELGDLGSNGFRISGIDDFDAASVSVSGAGDVNGDGLGDVIIGGPFADPGGRNRAGESYVVFGKADNTPVSLADVAGGSGGFVMNGIDESDYAGRSVSGAGDVNGDGLDDVIIGAYQAEDFGGQSYVVFGKVDGNPVELSDVALGNGGFLIVGIEPFDFSGRSVSGAGDVNGDGLDDLVIGAFGAEPGGESYVVFGKPDGDQVLLGNVASGIGGFVMRGVDQADFSGISVSGAGDVNNDGLHDVIVGNGGGDPGGNTAAGEAHVVFGKSDGTPVDLGDVATGKGGFVINGIDSGDSAGEAVSGAGDVNGDGFDDVIIGAYRGDPNGISDAGESFVVFGKVDGTPVELSDVAGGAGGFVINGAALSDSSGFAVSGTGDVNDDGLDDVLVGSPNADPDGKVFVVFGKKDGMPVEASDLAADNGGFILNGASSDFSTGLSVSGAGDVNADGVSDMLIGATSFDRAGSTYVVFGKRRELLFMDGFEPPL
ncbi:MAG: integrin alpha [Xanthomonadales bacterium]|nr:integrin alpha [Xanthomonadales bacterium]